MTFESLGLLPNLLKAIKKQGFAEVSPIQLKAIPEVLKGSDVLGIAKTGSGKTMAYVLPIINNFDFSDSKSRKIKVLVLVPTRELAVQVEEVFRQFQIAKSFNVKSVFGGVSINPQMKAMYGVDVLISTPGRLLELVKLNALQLSELRTLVLDEADKMLNLGFKDEMNKIFDLLPKERQNLLFSATLNKNVNTIQKGLLKNPIVIKVKDSDDSVDLINQQAYLVSDERKGPLLRYLIKTQNLQQVLVFVSSIRRADNVANKLRANGIEAWPIHSKKSQGARTDLLTKFKYGKLQVLVATDLISRGIDIEFLPCVVNYELPRSPKDYIHRIGRTGRAENPGQAISLITLADEHHFSVIEKKMGKKVDRQQSDQINLQGY